MEKTAFVDMVHLVNNVTVSASASCGDNIFVKRERNEDDDCKKVYSSTDCAHAFGNFDAIHLTQIAASETSLHKSRAKPSNHGVAEREGSKRQC